MTCQATLIHGQTVFNTQRHGLVPDGFGLDKSAGVLIKIAGVL
jgi:hypothetical protein